jgi:hypothetical protein
MEYTVLLLAFAWLTGLAFATALVGTWIARSRRSYAGASDGPGEGRRSVAGQKSERLTGNAAGRAQRVGAPSASSAKTWLEMRSGLNSRAAAIATIFVTMMFVMASSASHSNCIVRQTFRNAAGSLHNYDWWATLLASMFCSIGEVSSGRPEQSSSRSTRNRRPSVPGSSRATW